MNTLASLPQKVLVEHFKVTPAAVSKWFKRGRIPIGRVLEIEAAFGISRHDLRPDFFGPSPDRPAPSRHAQPAQSMGQEAAA